MSELKSYYHTCVIYPLDYIRKYIGSVAQWDELLDDLSLKLDCDYMISPLHSPDKKKHRHIIYRCPNKISGNTFQTLLCDAVNGDFRGLVYYADKGCINKIDRHIRYLIHLDNPSKQQFSRQDISYVGNWDKELYSAFGNEIMDDMTDLITSGACCSVSDLCSIYGFNYALRQGHNMYYINSLINDVEKRSRNL